MKEEHKTSKIKLISAGIVLLLGLILAIGYPTGGVKVERAGQRQIISKTVITPQTNTTSKSAVVKKEEPKKRVIPVAPPPNSDEAEEEGC